MADSKIHIVIKIWSFSKRGPVWGGVTPPTLTEHTTQKNSSMDPTFHDITAKTYYFDYTKLKENS